MSFQRCIRWRRIILLVCVFGILLVIPLNTAFAQDPEVSEQESNDRLLVTGAVILLVAAYTAIFVGEDADSRGKDGFQWGFIFFILVGAGPIVYYLLAAGNNDDKLITGGGIFVAAMGLVLGVYYLILRPRRLRFS